jgi:P pilus assembly chaperone PapD
MKKTMFFALLLGIQISFSQIAVLSDLSNDRVMQTGESATGSIQIRNETDEPQQAKIYQTDYTFQADGSNYYNPPGAHTRSNAAWITYTPSVITIAPRSTGTVSYVITVPMDSAQKKMEGSYWSVLMIEGLNKDGDESTLSGKKKRKEMNISQSMRYAVQLSATILNTGKKDMDIAKTELVKDDKGKHLVIDMKNTGTLFVRPDCYAEIYTLDGASCGKFYGSKFRLFPTTSVRNTIDLSTLTAGKYKALIVVDAGGDDVFGAEYEIAI